MNLLHYFVILLFQNLSKAIVFWWDGQRTFIASINPSIDPLIWDDTQKETPTAGDFV
jgi:hypothetical protein